MKRVAVFDVNETLLDLTGLRPLFTTVLPDHLMSLWFCNMLQNSLVSTVTGRYEPFDEQGVAALISVGARAGIAVGVEDARTVLRGLTKLPAHPDVIPALDALRSAGIPVAALTNSSRDVLEAQLGNAGISSYFAAALSVEAVGKFKPAPEAYRHAADAMGVDISKIWLVAVHDWDVTGAVRAGARGVFVARSGEHPGWLSEDPHFIASDLEAAAGVIARAV